MKKESILSEEEKMQKWQKIKDNRAKKQTNRREKATGTFNCFFEIGDVLLLLIDIISKVKAALCNYG
jgi:hypothetical protein